MHQWWVTSIADPILIRKLQSTQILQIRIAFGMPILVSYLQDLNLNQNLLVIRVYNSRYF